MTDSHSSISEMHGAGTSCDVRVRPVLHGVSVCAIAIGVRVCDVVCVELMGKMEKHSCEVEDMDGDINGEIEKHSDEVRHEHEAIFCVEMLVDDFASSISSIELTPKRSSTKSMANASSFSYSSHSSLLY